tara:strand:- start:812 stop:1084 length:273 start_codon:yes stop_codon:yes gene_type:complete
MTIICSDCKARCFPSDPTVPTFVRLGEYLKPICYYCPEWDPETEQETPKTQEIIHRFSNMGIKEYALLKDTVGKVAMLINRVYGNKTTYD